MEERGVAEGMKITQLNEAQFLSCFVDEEQAMMVLHEGRKWFDNNFMQLKRWLGHEVVLIHTAQVIQW